MSAANGGAGAPNQPGTIQIPTIQAVAVGVHERNINIFFVKQTINDDGTITEEDKESISFLSYMVQVWN